MNNQNNNIQYNKSRKGGGNTEKVPLSLMSSFGRNNAGAGKQQVPNNELILRAESNLSNSNGIQYFIKNGNYEKSKGLGWFVTGLFVVGDLAGGGLVALPAAMSHFGFRIGLFGSIFMTLIAFYTAYVLGQNWVILQRRWPHVYASGHCRKPYPEIALRAMGPMARSFISVCINITQFGIAVVYLLLSAKNIHDFLNGMFNIYISPCIIVIFVALALLPVTFLKSPQDFWGVVIMAMFTTTLAVILIIVGTILDYPTCAPRAEEEAFSFTNYFLALGTYVFSYGGHAVFPTIQHDMRKPHEFTKSSFLAFGIIAAMYIPVCIFGYITYGSSLSDSIVNSIQSLWIQQSVNVLITVHCILTLTIVFNPINQETEDHFHVPQHFCIQRVLVRTGTMCVVVLMAETVPKFAPILDLVGGSTLTLTSIILPALFYLYLSSSEIKANERQEKIIQKNGMKVDGCVISKNESEWTSEYATVRDIFERTDLPTLLLCIFVIVFGTIGGFAATVSAIHEISVAQFVPPCYVSAFMDTSSFESTSLSSTTCCGPYRNISRFAGTIEELRKICG